VAEYKLMDILQNTNPNDCFITLMVIEDSSAKTLSSNYYFPGNFSQTTLPKANISMENVKNIDDYTIQV
jgi:hypothetical protein